MTEEAAPVGRCLFDTSVFVAFEVGRPVDRARLPKQVSISVITHAELQAGVLAADDLDVRARRMQTIRRLAGMTVLPIDQTVADRWALLRATLGKAHRRVNVNDLWIAATALANGLPVVTQDADFDPLVEVANLTVIRV